MKVPDFGIARVREPLASQENRALTTTGLMLGSPLYMSPEQVVGAKGLDHRTDLWSLGVVLHEALTGRTPYGHVVTVGLRFLAIMGHSAHVFVPLGVSTRRGEVQSLAGGGARYPLSDP